MSGYLTQLYNEDEFIYIGTSFNDFSDLTQSRLEIPSGIFKIVYKNIFTAAFAVYRGESFVYSNPGNMYLRNSLDDISPFSITVNPDGSVSGYVNGVLSQTTRAISADSANPYRATNFALAPWSNIFAVPSFIPCGWIQPGSNSVMNIPCSIFLDGVLVKGIDSSIVNASNAWAYFLANTNTGIINYITASPCGYKKEFYWNRIGLPLFYSSFSGTMTMYNGIDGVFSTVPNIDTFAHVNITQPSVYADIVMNPSPPSPLNTYSISYSSSIGGTVSGVSSASTGITVTIVVTPDTGYNLSSLAVYKTASQNPVDYTKVNDTTYTFVMPDANVTVTGIFVKGYTVTGTAFPNNTGSITVTSPHRANENVSFTVVPNEGYYVDSVRVYGLSNSREFEWNEETLQGSFSMPPRNVDVVAYLSNRLDPNDQGGTSQPAGGGGSFNIASDLIPVPAVIGNGILQNSVTKGLITAYNPSVTTVADVGNWLYATDWGDAIYQGFRDLFVKPIDSLISLMILPVVPHSSTNGKITFGPHNTFLSAPVIDQQYVDKDLGYLEIKEYWGSYLDYNPFTKIQLFLPFIGSVDLDTDLVMGKTIKIKYRIDILTGACVAFLATYENNSESVFSEFTGHCGMQIPISATDSSSIASALMTTSALVLTKGASAIASDQSAALKVTQATNRSQLATYAVAKGNVSKEAIKERHDAAKALEEAKAFEKGVNSKNAQALEYPVTYTVGHVMGSKVTSTISGSVSGGPGLMGNNKPFLIIRRPRQSLAEEYKHYVGYPCNMTCKLGTLSGFTRVEQVWLENVPCTDEEIADIITSLKEGVVI